MNSRLLEFDKTCSWGLYKALLEYDTQRWNRSAVASEIKTCKVLSGSYNQPKGRSRMEAIAQRAIGMVVGMALVAGIWGAWLGYTETRRQNLTREMAAQLQEMQQEVARPFPQEHLTQEL